MSVAITLPKHTATMRMTVSTSAQMASTMEVMVVTMLLLQYWSHLRTKAKGTRQ